MPGARLVQASSGTLTTSDPSTYSTLVEGPAGVRRAVVAVRGIAGRHQRGGLLQRVVGLDVAELPEQPRALRGVADEVDRHRRRLDRRRARLGRAGGVAGLVAGSALRGLVGPGVVGHRLRVVAAAGEHQRERGGRQQRGETSPGSHGNHPSRLRRLFHDDRARVGERPGSLAAGRVVGHRDEGVGAGSRGRIRRPRSPTCRAGRPIPRRSASHPARPPARRGSPTARSPRTSWRDPSRRTSPPTCRPSAGSLMLTRDRMSFCGSRSSARPIEGRPVLRELNRQLLAGSGLERVHDLLNVERAPRCQAQRPASELDVDRPSGTSTASNEPRATRSDSRGPRTARHRDRFERRERNAAGTCWNSRYSRGPAGVSPTK